MKKFRKKTTEVYAFQFTKELQKGLIAMGKNENENPVDITLPQIPNVKAYWNWHLQELYIYNFNAESAVKLNNWIVSYDMKEFFIMTNERFKEEFEIM